MKAGLAHHWHPKAASPQAPSCRRVLALGSIPGQSQLGSARRSRSRHNRGRPADNVRQAAWKDLTDGIENYETVIGDSVLLVAFACYKQIAGIALSPDFPGWTAPLEFNPFRFIEFAGFLTGLLSAWFLAGVLVGAYRYRATRDVPVALKVVSLTWSLSMPIAASQLVLTTAIRSSTLVGDVGWAAKLPLAASGPGEPFVTAAGVLGLMAMWRSFYCVWLDFWAASYAADEQVSSFNEALRMVVIMSALSLLMLKVLGAVLTVEQVEAVHDLAEQLARPLLPLWPTSRL